MKDKVFTSNDGAILLHSIHITHVCVAPCLFAFLQYLLLVDENTAKYHTYYFFTDVIPESIHRRLASTCYVREKDTNLITAVKKRLKKLHIAWFKSCTYPFLKTAHIFAFDFPVLCLYIGNRPYDLLSDAPGCITYNMQENSEEYRRQMKLSGSLLGKIQKLLYGDVYINYYGNNKWCKSIFLTEENISPILNGKDVHIQSLDSLWDAASESKRQFIMSLFDITDEDIKLLNSKPYLYFSQPLREDCDLTDKEFSELLRRLFAHYDVNNILVKTHPRDKFDYKAYFPDITIYSKPVNSQFLQLFGLKPKKVITFFSSAVESFSDTVECDYYGVEIHPNVYARYGAVYQPKRKVNRMKL